MRKTLLTLCLCVSTLLSAAGLHVMPVSNSEITVGPAASTIPHPASVVKAPALEEGQEMSMDFTLAEDPYTALALNAVSVKGEFACAFELNSEYATKFAGAQITSINVCSGVNTSTNKNRITDITVFITEDLQGTPVYEQAGKLGTEAFTYYNVELTTPYTIEAGKKIYIGFTGKKQHSKDYYIVVDGIARSNDEGGWIASKNISTKKWSWSNASSEYGYVCLGATIKGNNLPTNSADAAGVVLPQSADANEPFKLGFEIRNNGANLLENVEVSYKIGESEPIVKTLQFAQSLGSCKTGVVEIDDAVSAESGMKVPVEFTVTKVNGQENNGVNTTTTGSLLCFAQGGFLRRMVIEEGTATWCGWCPLGFNTMEYIRENYEGLFIPIGVHSGDEMSCTSYNGFLNAFTPYLPGAAINRDIKIDPREFDAIIDYYEQNAGSMTFAGVELQCDYTDDTKSSLLFVATTRFAFDTNNNNTYALSFVITEDGVGPYSQNNSYSGQTDDCGGWESKPPKVSMLFNDVARNIYTYAGIPNSVPSTISAYTPNEFAYTMSLSKVSNPDNINAIALLINKKTKVIENAVMLKPSQFTGIESTVDKAEALSIKAGYGAVSITGDYNLATVYTISGMKVAEVKAKSHIALPAGFYIVKVDDTVKKVIVK